MNWRIAPGESISRGALSGALFHWSMKRFAVDLGCALLCVGCVLVLVFVVAMAVIMPK